MNSNMADEKDEHGVETLFTLFTSGDQVFVWNADEAFLLRSKYRIVGSLVGSLPRKPNQNLCFSLPLALMREEATLLLDKGLARIVYSSEVVCKPSKEEIEEFKALRDQSVRNQLELFKKEREEKQRELSVTIESGRKRKRRQEETTGNQTPAERPGSTVEMFKHGDLATAKTDEDDERTSTCKNTPRVPKDFHASSKVPTFFGCKHAKLSAQGEFKDFIKEKALVGEEQSSEVNESWMIRSKSLTDDKTKTTADKIEKEESECQSNEPAASAVLFHIPTAVPLHSIPHKPVDWKYPYTDEDKLRYRIFSDLWQKGYYITSGARFGGDYLAYPGDPGRFHSFYIIAVLPWGRKVTALDIISLGRLGSTVKKTAVFCSVDKDNQVIYTSVKWTGIN